MMNSYGIPDSNHQIWLEVATHIVASVEQAMSQGKLSESCPSLHLNCQNSF
jgi:hypothetical protein